MEQSYWIHGRLLASQRPSMRAPRYCGSSFPPATTPCKKPGRPFRIQRERTETVGTMHNNILQTIPDRMAIHRRQLPKPARLQQRRHSRHIPKRLHVPLPLQHQPHHPQRPTHHPRAPHHRHPGLNQQPRILQPLLPARRRPRPRHQQ